MSNLKEALEKFNKTLKKTKPNIQKMEKIAPFNNPKARKYDNPIKTSGARHQRPGVQVQKKNTIKPIL